MNDDPTTPAPEAAPASGRKRVAARVAVAVLLLAAVGGAAAYTKVTVDGADRTSEAAVWQKPAHKPGKDPAGDVSRGRASTALSKLLLPVPAGYRLGPDVDEHGNDGELSGRAATAEMKDMGRGLAGKERRELERRIDKLKIQGVAVRSYASNRNDLVIDTQLVRMKDKKGIRDLYALQAGLFEDMGVFRDGPKISGHRNKARCFRTPKDEEQRLDGVYCVAYEDELMFTFSAWAPAPADTSAIAELVKDQLNHITSPGEYV
ncbi:hypothetical protein ABZ565_23085 [Streptomyces sp. NPDC016469]|uniref:hypothetical protein n=1 Tax=Streptomyces sp. NPDC016469 TaxID=3157191 RepID=UPI0033FC85B9